MVLARFVLATGSRVYAAPEVVDPTKRYDGFLADVFSCGIILYAMITASWVALPGGYFSCWSEGTWCSSLLSLFSVDYGPLLKITGMPYRTTKQAIEKNLSWGSHCVVDESCKGEGMPGPPIFSLVLPPFLVLGLTVLTVTLLLCLLRRSGVPNVGARPHQADLYRRDQGTSLVPCVSSEFPFRGSGGTVSWPQIIIVVVCSCHMQRLYRGTSGGSSRRGDTNCTGVEEHLPGGGCTAASTFFASGGPQRNASSVCLPENLRLCFHCFSPLACSS